jgi:hypothetical protein
MSKFIVIIGLLRAGFRVVGPFATKGAAEAFADRCDDATEVMRIDPPEMFDDEPFVGSGGASLAT